MAPKRGILILALALSCASPSKPEITLLPLPKEASFSGRWVPTSEPVTVMTDSIPGARLNAREAYRLTIGPEGIQIEAVTEAGAWNAKMTLRQLERDGKVPEGSITDWPSFRARGWMLDCGRTYISMEELKREADNLSRFKLNTFHWHLTDNQAFRLESRRHPEINGGMTRQPGLFYTQDEARELVRYCRERNITLIPEIDVPGHSAYFERIYGFGMQSPRGKEIVKELLEEVCEVFADSPWIHIGTDETDFTDPSFVPEMVTLVRSHGKKAVSWKPGWNYAPGEIDMEQLWSDRGEAQEGVPAIDCRLHYVNHFDLFGDIVGLHTSRIYRADEGSEDLAGSIVALWSDRFLTPERQIPLQNNLYASAIALADRGWRGGGYQYFDDFGVILPESGPAHDDFACFEQRMCALAGELVAPYRPQSDIVWQISEAFPNEGDLTKSFAPETGDYDWSRGGSAIGYGIYLRHVWGPSTVKGYFENPEPRSTVYARRIIRSEKDREAKLWFETQNYSRSERDLPPPDGEWDHRKSRIWINGEPVSPPEWSEDRGREDIDSPLGNENCSGRDPLQIKLRKGDNEILVKLPVGEFSTPEYRLVKWMFTCVVE